MTRKYFAFCAKSYSRVISDIIDYTVCLICRDELGMIFDTLAVTQMVTRREMNNSLQKTE